MKRNIKYLLSGLMSSFILLFSYSFVYAADCGSSGGGLSNPLQNICSFEDFVALLLKAVVNIGLPIAVLFIVYSGFLFVTARGSVDGIKKAKEVFFYTIIGVTIFLGSWAIALIVKNTIKLLTG